MAIAARTYLRLRFLDAAAIANKFAGVLSEREMRSMLLRRNKARGGRRGGGELHEASHGFSTATLA